MVFPLRTAAWYENCRPFQHMAASEEGAQLVGFVMLTVSRLPRVS